MYGTVTEQESRLPDHVWVHNESDKDFDYQIPEMANERVTIPAKGKIKTTRRNGVRIRGYYPGKEDKVSIRLEPIPNETAEQTASQGPKGKPRAVYFCPVCDTEYGSKAEAKTCMRKCLEEDDVAGVSSERRSGSTIGAGQ